MEYCQVLLLFLFPVLLAGSKRVPQRLQNTDPDKFILSHFEHLVDSFFSNSSWTLR